MKLMVAIAIFAVVMIGFAAAHHSPECIDATTGHGVPCAPADEP